MNELTIHDYLQKKGLSEYGIAGLMGNLFAESGLNPRNLQNSYENVLGMNDNAYVAAVDNGTYTNFVQDKAGFGLAQWTFWTRKQALLDFDGTLIVVSHDRDFLDGLVTKVYEFGNKQVKEHLSGIYEFLEKKKMESLRELER